MKRAIMICTILTIITPIVFIILFSLFSYYKYPLLLPTKFSLDYWGNNLFRNGILVNALKTSLIIGIINGISSTVLAWLFAIAVTKYEFFGKKLLLKIYSIPLFLPAISLFIGVHLIMIKLHLVNSIVGVVIAHTIISVPYSTSILYSFLSGMNKNLVNAAKMLGSSNIQYFYKIELPLASPALSLSFSIGFLLSFSEYLSTYLVGGGSVISLSTVIYPIVQNGDRGNGTVLGIIFIIVNLIVFTVSSIISKKLSGKENYLYEA